MRYITLLTLILLSACAAHKPGSATIGGGIHLNPPDLAGLLEGKAYVQTFEIFKDNRPFHFNGHAELAPNELVLVGLTPVGSRGFAATWRDGIFSYEHLPLYRLPLSPEELLLAWQMVFLSTETWTAETARTGLRLQLVSGATRERRFLNGEQTLVRISYLDNNEAVLENLARRYRLTIHTRSVTPFEL